MQVEPAAIAVGGVAHDTFVFETEALLEVAGADIVVEDVEKEAVGTEFAEGDALNFGEDAPAHAAARCGDHDSFQFN